MFYDVAENVDIALDDESYFDKKFSISYTTKQINELDDDGEENGEKIILIITEED